MTAVRAEKPEGGTKEKCQSPGACGSLRLVLQQYFVMFVFDVAWVHAV
jgi:hypothetical protein